MMRTIEFIGMPRAGKTTQLHILKDSLLEQGYKVAILDDRNRPGVEHIPVEESLAFIMMRATTALSYYFKCLHDQVDFLLLDRGINDTLAWAGVYQAQKRITPEESLAVHNSLSRYFSLTDTVLFFDQPTEISIARHAATGIHDPIDDIVMTPSYLNQLHQSYRDIMKYFDNVTTINGLDSIDHTSQKIAELIRD